MEAATTVKFSVLLPLALSVAGEKADVTPAGKPLTESDAEVIPLCVSETVSEPELLSGMVKEATLDVIASDGAATTSATVVVAFSEPLVPVMVSVEVLAEAVEAAVSFSALAVVPLTEAGEKTAVTPEGKPETVRTTAELKPFWPVNERLTEPELPGTSESEVALEETVKLGAGTTTEMATVAVMPPPVPVTVKL